MMKKLTTLGVVLALSLGATGIAAAQTDHGHGAQTPGAMEPSTGGQTGLMGGNQADMMRNMMPMMMQMHAGTMGAGGMGMMGAGGMQGMSMMDRDMMQMMMGPDKMEMPSADAFGAAMQSRMAEFDADGNGSLSLAEFETLHAAMIRETMVDRFQHLDADGDGQITQDEMGAPSRRMEMRGTMDSESSMTNGRNGMTKDESGMMNDTPKGGAGN